jgi:hypothetical protein
MKFLVGLVVGAIIAAAIGAAAIAYAFGDLDRINVGDRDKSNDATKTLELRDFERIDVKGVFELDVTVGSDFAVTVSGPQDELDRVEASVVEGRLILDQKHKIKGMRRHGHDGVTARVTMPALKAVNVSGVVDGEISGVAATEFDVDISGVGDLEIAGTCEDLDADVSGVGDLDASELRCKNVNVTVSGVGEASVYASEAVAASVSGMGEINVDGSPKSVQKNGGLFADINVN